MKKILILTSGPISKLEGFEKARSSSKVDFDLRSFDDISYLSKAGKVICGEFDLKEYSLIYFRLVGKSLETAALVSQYARENGVKLIDDVYEKSHVLVTTVSKYLEHYKLSSVVNIPETFFGATKVIQKKGHAIFGKKYIVKSTSGRKARDVWLIDKDNEEETFQMLREREIEGDRFFAQTYIPSSTRIRVLVVGGDAVGGVVRPSKYLKSVIEGISEEEKEALKIGFSDVPKEYRAVAVKAAKAVDLNISGVDILKNDKTGELFVIEVNAAPAWNLINKYSGIVVEELILKYLAKLIK